MSTQKTRSEYQEVPPVIARLSGQLVQSCPTVHLRKKCFGFFINMLVLEYHEMNQCFLN